MCARRPFTITHLNDNILVRFVLQHHYVYDVRCGPLEAVARFPRQCVGDNGNAGIVRLRHVPGHSVHRLESCRTVPVDKYAAICQRLLRMRLTIYGTL